MFICNSVCKLERMFEHPRRDYQYCSALNDVARKVHVGVALENVRRGIVKDYVLPLLVRARDYIEQSSRKSRELFLDAMNMRVSVLQKRYAA